MKNPNSGYCWKWFYFLAGLFWIFQMSYNKQALSLELRRKLYVLINLKNDAMLDDE